MEPRRRPSASTVFVLVVIVATVAYLIWHAITVPTTPEVVIGESSAQPYTGQTSSPATSSTSEIPSEDTATQDVLLSRSIQLVEAYLTLQPTDTPEMRRQRMVALNVPTTVLDTLDLTVGSLSCSDQARLNPDNPLAQKPTVMMNSATVNVYPFSGGKLAYIVMPARVALYQQDGEAAKVDGCITSGTTSVGVTWLIGDDESQTLTSLTTPGGSSL